MAQTPEKRPVAHVPVLSTLKKARFPEAALWRSAWWCCAWSRSCPSSRASWHCPRCSSAFCLWWSAANSRSSEGCAEGRWELCYQAADLALQCIRPALCGVCQRRTCKTMWKTKRLRCVAFVTKCFQLLLDMGKKPRLILQCGMPCNLQPKPLKWTSLKPH